MKKIFWKIEDFTWGLRCSFNYWLHGPYGLSKVIERIPLRFLIKYLKKYGATIGSGVVIDSGFKIHRPDRQVPFKNLIIGNNVYIGHGLLMDLTDKIIFEDNTAVGANCQIWTHVGDYKNNLRDKTDYNEKIASVILQEGVVCYSNVILNPGVVISKNSRVYALSIVSGTIPDSEIWGGVPAKKLKNRLQEK